MITNLPIDEGAPALLPKGAEVHLIDEWVKKATS
jgi:hypothetical protein